MPDPVPLPITFRPAMALRVISAIIGILCVITAVANLVDATVLNWSVRLPAAGLLFLPYLMALWIVRRKVVLSADGITVSGVFRRRHIPWSDVLAVEQTRKSFVIITAEGDVSAGWIAAETRDLLFRKVLELAKLALEPKEQRWGITARFIRSPEPNLISPAQILRSRPFSTERDE